MKWKVKSYNGNGREKKIREKLHEEETFYDFLFSFGPEINLI